MTILGCSTRRALRFKANPETRERVIKLPQCDRDKGSHKSKRAPEGALNLSDTDVPIRP